MSSIVHMSSIVKFFEGEMTLFSRGENSFKSKKVVHFSADPDHHYFKGRVAASMKKKEYTVEIHCDESYKIIDGKCSCPRGLVRCHHMAALLFYAYSNVSITDSACSWNAPKGATETEMRPIEEGHEITSYGPLPNFDPSQFQKKFREKFSKYPIGLVWITNEEPTADENASLFASNAVIEVKKIICSDLFRDHPNRTSYFRQMAAISSETATNIFEETIGQRTNPLWGKVRKDRLTASNFGAVISSSLRNRFPLSLFKTLSGKYNCSGAKAIMWGVENESVAVEEFMKATNKKVTPCGIYLASNGFLGASPDGFVEGEESIVEIKCPFKYRDIDFNFNDQSYIIYKDDNGSFVINDNHDYYHQIQGTLHICNKQLCYLVIYTLKSLNIFQISKNEDWGGNLTILEQFYLNHYLNYLIKDQELN